MAIIDLSYLLRPVDIKRYNISEDPLKNINLQKEPDGIDLWEDIEKSKKILEKLKDKEYAIKLNRTITDNKFLHKNGSKSLLATYRTTAGFITDTRNSIIPDNNERYVEIYREGGWGETDNEVLKDLEELGWTLISEIFEEKND